MTVLSTNKLFPEELVTDLVTKVQGKSSLANLRASIPVKFNGQREFVFNFDKEIDIVAENGKKSEGGVSLEPVTILPIKFEYGARVSNEFLMASEEAQINILQEFNDGFAKKVARGLDIAAFHGLNPRTGTASSVINTNHFDSKVTNTVTYDSTTCDDCLNEAISQIADNEKDVTGVAIAPSVRSDLSKMKNKNGEFVYPEFKFGGVPATLGSQKLEVNSTVSFGTETKDVAIVGDFANMFKWGYAGEIPFEVIEYGDPDQSGKDLKAYNQVYLRAEIFLGWAILDPSSFTRLVTAG